MRSVPRNRHGERGQTIILVAISLLSLLAMAALAIDVVTLYVAKSEIQRAADTAALAGAKAIADSGVTSLPLGDPNLVQVETLASQMAQAAILAVLASPVNLVAGQQPTWPAGVVTPVYQDTTGNGLTNNPTVTITLQSANLPIFFARIWSQSAFVTATATAEAYNPSNMQNFTPIAPRCVKPWLVANSDPNGGTTFVNPATGVTEADAVGHSFTLRGDCNFAKAPNCVPIETPTSSSPYLDFVPALVSTNTTSTCPAACQGVTSFECSIECCDNSTTYACGGSTSNAFWDPTVYPNGAFGPDVGGVNGLIHATSTGTGQGQDQIFNPGPWPNAPLYYAATSGPLNGQAISTSVSVVTIPIIDPTTFSSGCTAQPCPVTIVGFLEAFIADVNSKGQVDVVLLNIAGCSNTPSAANPVVGGSGASAIPIRLISPPS